MKLHDQVQNQAVLSNVGQIGEFRIRNSAKAFNILSSGLYANKIRAIIRELSCNAVDSHVAAGHTDRSFDVHLPNALEPWFSIRDYGVGLDHEQVTNIYTTYFESTKTSSNDFIGALGLGSKSPFSYTDNFTVTAIKDGRRGIYTAFINDQGVPSIAMMQEDTTDELNGVEVKFAVNSIRDFDKFRSEAKYVYSYFAHLPRVQGCDNFEIPAMEYETRDIIPGVHSLVRSMHSVAVMGNIAYPIQVPEADNSLGPLRDLLKCGLEMHFDIGELDFQASREGLSYIPSTIEAIRQKLEQVNAALSVTLAREADGIPNLWNRADFVMKKSAITLWKSATLKYVQDSGLPTVAVLGNGISPRRFYFRTADLAKNYNILIRGFQKSRNLNILSRLRENLEHEDEKNDKGDYDAYTQWIFSAVKNSVFVVNDTKTSALNRAKNHFKLLKIDHYSQDVFVIEPKDRSRPIKIAEFFQLLLNPPQDQCILVSNLDPLTHAKKLSRNAVILRLEERRSGYRYRDDRVWRDVGKLCDLDPNRTYYYIPLVGFQMISTKGYTSPKELLSDLKSLPGLFDGDLYGVRKTDLEIVKQQKNWVNIEEYVSAKLISADMDKIVLGIVRSGLDQAEVLNYNNKEIIKLIDTASPYAMFVKQFLDIEKAFSRTVGIERLFNLFGPGTQLNFKSRIDSCQTKLGSLNRRYPLLKSLNSYRVNSSHIAEYINLIDKKLETV